MKRRTIVQRLPRVVRNGVIDAYSYANQRRNGYEKERPPLEYWSQPPGSGHGNSPESYAASTDSWDAEWMLGTVTRRFPHGGTVLEFGCNAGRVLRHFARAGYSVVGLEINPQALELARRTFPELKDARLLAGNGEETLQCVPTASADVSYSSHALRHVGTSLIESVAKELTRVTRALLITSEDEGTLSSLSYPRNYRTLFEPLGWKQVERHYVLDLTDDPDVSITSKIRLFRKALP